MQKLKHHFQSVIAQDGVLVCDDFALVELMALNVLNQEARLCRLTRDLEVMPFLQVDPQQTSQYFIRLGPAFEIVASATLKPRQSEIIELVDGELFRLPEGARSLSQVGVSKNHRHQGHATKILQRIRDEMDQPDWGTMLVLTSYHDDGLKYLRPKVRSVFANAPIPVLEYEPAFGGFRPVNQFPTLGTQG